MVESGNADRIDYYLDQGQDRQDDAERGCERHDQSVSLEVSNADGFVFGKVQQDDSI